MKDQERKLQIENDKLKLERLNHGRPLAEAENSELQAAAQFAKSHAALLYELTEARTEIENLKERMAKLYDYAEHTPKCSRAPGIGCDCGLVELIQPECSPSIPDSTPTPSKEPQAHSAEPWVNRSGLIVTKEGEDIANCWGFSLGIANAARIVSAVNFCAGLSNEEIANMKAPAHVCMRRGSNLKAMKGEGK